MRAGCAHRSKATLLTTQLGLCSHCSRWCHCLTRLVGASPDMRPSRRQVCFLPCHGRSRAAAALHVIRTEYHGHWNRLLMLMLLTSQLCGMLSLHVGFASHLVGKIRASTHLPQARCAPLGHACAKATSSGRLQYKVGAAAVPLGNIYSRQVRTCVL